MYFACLIKFYFLILISYLQTRGRFHKARVNYAVI